MTRFLTILCLFTILASCKTETKDQTQSEITAEQSTNKKEEEIELTVAEKIAQAHGFEHWKNINEIQFTFNVNRGENHFERTWKWQPKENNVVSMVSKDSLITYTRTEMDSINIQLDQAFINDKFWMLVPFQLVWDDGTTISESVKEIAPISKTELNKITLTYGNEGGYTPGDAYDIYVDNDFMIREWVFRKGNSEEPSMITTFENYEDFNGIKIAKDHKTAEGNFNLNFSNIKVN